MIPLSALGAIW